MDAKSRKARDVFKRVLPEIIPTKNEVRQTVSNVNWLMERLRKIVPPYVELRVTGSISKSTNLKGDSDIDLFLLFPQNTKRSELIKLGLSYGKKVIGKSKSDKYEIKYAEHPYVQLFIKSRGIKVDVVPALKIDNIERLATSVDRTPLHTEFINSNLTDKQRNDVRLLKYFLKAHNIYGAEVKTSGFSGYLCELLIYYFGSLESLLKSASSFQLPVVLDTKKGHSNDKELAERFSSEFVVVDPVDPERNVAAGASIDSLSRFVIAARRFIEKPDIKEFYGGGFSSTKVGGLVNNFIKEMSMRSFLLVLNVPNKSEDVIWPQLRRESEILADYISRFGFKVYLIVPWISSTKGFLLFIAPDEKIGARLLKGPDAFRRYAAENFLRSHKNALGLTIKDGSLHAIEPNKYKTLEAVLRSVIKGNKISKRKEINLKGAKLFVDKIPKEYAEGAYTELMGRLSV